MKIAGRHRLVIAATAVALVVAFFVFDLGRWLTLAALKAGQATLDGWYAESPLLVIVVYFLAYVMVTALSLPGAAVMTLAGGALFGLVVGTVVVSFASTLGATLAFFVSRLLLRDWVQRRFADRLAAIDRGIEKDGAFYLFTLRLVPLFPFFAINLAMGLTPIRAATFYWVSQIGMLAGTIVYVNAGTQLARIEALDDILSPTLIGSFALLGFLPLLAKRFIDLLRRRKVYAGWTRPARFDRNLVVIGAGAGGLVASYVAAALKAKVTLIEGRRMGGDCLNTGCVPSKALIRTARFLRDVRRAAELGVGTAEARADFADVIGRVHRIIGRVAPHDSVERFTGLGVEVIEGHARLTSPWTVEIEGPAGRRTLTSRAIVIATGGAPVVPPVPGIGSVRHVTSDTIWSLQELPRRLAVLGGGPIGCELAQAFAALGSEVTQVARSGLLGKEDQDVSEAVGHAMRADGVRLLTGTATVRCAVVDGEQRLVVRHGEDEESVPFDVLLCATGRKARTTGFGLEELGIPLTRAGTIEVDEFLRTRYPNIYACGDVAGPMQFTHFAAHQAWYAAVNALFAGIRRFRADYRVIPRVIFTAPEVARVGLNETGARAHGIPHEVTRYGLDELDRAIADGDAHGFIKVLTPPGKDTILGVTIVGEHAGELLAEFTLAMKHGIGLDGILRTIHPYPTWSEAAKYTAGNWKKAHAPQAVLDWLARFHAWRL